MERNPAVWIPLMTIGLVLSVIFDGLVMKSLGFLLIVLGALVWLGVFEKKSSSKK